jgi:hypothetical protein
MIGIMVTLIVLGYFLNSCAGNLKKEALCRL